MLKGMKGESKSDVLIQKSRMRYSDAWFAIREMQVACSWRAILAAEMHSGDEELEVIADYIGVSEKGEHLGFDQLARRFWVHLRLVS